MVALLVIPESQFIDADGNPYAGGTVTTYVRGTTTPKDTWLDPGGTTLNTNPIVLDSAGRCVMYGDGEYRLVLEDALGNLIWDQVSSTIVSAAMAPVVIAPTIADALVLLGIQAMIDSAVAGERTRAQAAEATLQANINTTNTNLANAEIALTAAINAETARAEAAEAGLTSSNKVQRGMATTDAAGHGTVTFPNAYTSAPSVVVEQIRGSADVVSDCLIATSTGFDVYFAFPLSSGITPAGTRQFYWIAVGT
jgi:hypothetical protein